MEPNVFVSYIKVDFARFKYYAAKAFLTEDEADRYGKEVVAGVDKRLTTFECKYKVLTLALNVVMTPGPAKELSFEECVWRGVKSVLDFHYEHVIQK